MLMLSFNKLPDVLYFWFNSIPQEYRVAEKHPKRCKLLGTPSTWTFTVKFSRVPASATPHSFLFSVSWSVSVALHLLQLKFLVFCFYLLYCIVLLYTTLQGTVAKDKKSFLFTFQIWSCSLDHGNDKWVLKKLGTFSLKKIPRLSMLLYYYIILLLKTSFSSPKFLGQFLIFHSQNISSPPRKKDLD